MYLYIELDDDYSEEEMIKLDMMYDDLNKFLKTNFLQEYVALYLMCLYKYDFLDEKTTDLVRHINSAIDTFNNVKYNDVNFRKVKQILKQKYNLIIVKEEPYLELKEI